LFELSQRLVKLFAGRYAVAAEVEIIFKKSLAVSARWIKFSPPNENWAQRRVPAIKIRV
jgi:hypothetical protein